MGLATVPFWKLALLYPQVILQTPHGGGLLYSVQGRAVAGCYP